MFWGVALALAVWLAVDHEVDELLDDTLHDAAQVLGSLLIEEEVLRHARDLPAQSLRGSSRGSSILGDRFAWQLVDPQGHVLLRSPAAPEVALHERAAAGFDGNGQWRSFGLELTPSGQVLYVMQSRAERWEATSTAAFSSALAALVVGVLGHLWLRMRVQVELGPIRRLSDRLRQADPGGVGGVGDLGEGLGEAERDELEPVHRAVEDLARRLSRRLDHERAFTSHAAHALRTPLAGIDAQLAMALREVPPEQRPRLQRVRDATGRLQRVVAALLALFRSGVELSPRDIELEGFVARLPVAGLDLTVAPGSHLWADADLLAAALVNLLDNAVRHGAGAVRLSAPTRSRLRLDDDGPGVTASRRQELQLALAEQRYEGRMGLGLMLADMVARAHGGALCLPDVPRGFQVELLLAPADRSALAADGSATTEGAAAPAAAD